MSKGGILCEKRTQSSLGLLLILHFEDLVEVSLVKHPFYLTRIRLILGLLRLMLEEGTLVHCVVAVKGTGPAYAGKLALLCLVRRSRHQMPGKLLP
jgi:hypothetical protein